ncbi:2-hydroxy-3-oxopropionate reductase [Gracilibacillus alcaliphilus]|uniref:2-hydroxy-3-oxopropionate reductase n=1 Tax=Gracilibacillus alcaliphilus TaxID=1401441 RepID=UPI00308411DB|nr:2-hydroxy-3-oxopropionate reductase [Gracilibacillus alcaliphilus]
MERIGFIGLGIMGKPMAKNLIKSGYQLVIYNRSREATLELAEEGAEFGHSPKEVANKVDVLITMLPNGPDVEEVLLGEDGAILGLSPGNTVIDMSSISPIVAKRIAGVLHEKNIAMIDAPVSGGEPGAKEGTLAIMVGANKEDFSKCYGILSAMGKTVTRVGEIGSGNVVKLVNQSIVALNIAAISEALLLGAKCGVNPPDIYKAINEGLAGSNVLNAKFPMMMENNYEPGFTLELHKKDLDNVLSTADSINYKMPLTSMVTEFVDELIKDRQEKSDHSALLKYFEKLSSFQLLKGQDYKAEN